MKIKLYQLTLFITALFIFGCTSTDDELEMQSVNQHEISKTEYSKIVDHFDDIYYSINNAPNNSALYKSENNGNGVYIVPFYSDSPEDRKWAAFFPMSESATESVYMLLEFPRNGEDKALVFSETEMMANFTSHDPRLFIIDFATEEILYDNWCDPDRSGLYKGRIKTTYVGRDLYAPFDGAIDNYWWGPDNDSGTELDKNGLFHVKATLTAGPCNVDGEPVAFSYTLQVKNGRLAINTTMR